VEGYQHIPGVKKAALFLLVMGEDFTSEVFKHLEENEVKLIGEQMAQINNIDYSQISGIMDEFSQRTGSGEVLGISGKDFLQRTFPKAFGSKKAGDLLGDLFAKRGSRSFEKLNSLNPQILGNLLINEHPQTIALILSNLKHQNAADIIAQLPEDTQSEVIMRISDLEEVPNDILGEVQEVIAQIKEGVTKVKPKVSLSVGDNVRVIDGPFVNFVGTVEEVKPDKRKVKVLVSIFGRSTPVELDFIQVEKS